VYGGQRLTHYSITIKEPFRKHLPCQLLFIRSFRGVAMTGTAVPKRETTTTTIIIYCPAADRPGRSADVTIITSGRKKKNKNFQLKKQNDKTPASGETRDVCEGVYIARDDTLLIVEILLLLLLLLFRFTPLGRNSSHAHTTHAH